MGSEAQDKFKKRLIQRFKILLVGISICLILFLFVRFQFETSIRGAWDRFDGLSLDFGKTVFVRFENPSESFPVSDYSDNPEVPLNLSSFSNCSAIYRLRDIVPSPKEKWTTKPLFVPMMPHTISDAMHKHLINRLTRLPAGGKSFYSSKRKELRHCKGNTETATCTTHHPIVRMNKGQPDSFSHFNENYIYMIRNPMFLFPASLNARDFHYRGIDGQTNIENWVDFRDKYLHDFMQQWKESLTTWKKSRYKLATYLTYEELMDVQRGPRALKRVAGILKDAGFYVIEDDDAVNCIWYDAIGSEQIRRHHTKHYDYDEYIPPYKIDQQELMLTELENFLNECIDDDELIKILHRYIVDIRLHMKVV